MLKEAKKTIKVESPQRPKNSIIIRRLDTRPLGGDNDEENEMEELMKRIE